MKGLLFYLILLGPKIIWAIAPFEQVRRLHQVSEVSLLDRNGEVLQKGRVNFQSRKLEWVPLGEVSSSLREAILFIEDRRFYKHHGVDYLALGKATWDQVPWIGSKNRGASTITMQLAGILNPNLTRRRGRRSLWQKLNQIREAKEIEQHWSKDEIMEAYLNLVSFHGDKKGVRAASRLLLGKDPHGLTEGESIFLASRIRSPAVPLEKQRVRICGLYKRWKKSVECNEIDGVLATLWSSPSYTSQSPSLAYHLLAKLKSKDRMPGGEREIRTSLDRNLQEYAQESLRNQISVLNGKNVHDGAVLVIENRTGLVRAYVANVGEGSTALYVDGITALRQAGSTLKPFIYATAFEREILKPESLLEDSPTEIAIDGGRGVYRPQNYDNQFHGWVSAKQALASSLNLPALKVFLQVEATPVLEKLGNLGFTQLREAEAYGPSLALGTADISLWELTNAYRTLANDGKFSEASFFGAHLMAERRVFSSKAVGEVSEILSDREARSLSFGLENALSTRHWSAVKTGTSKDMRDNWCVGYGRNYTVGVWVGNLSGESMWNVSGVAGAAPVWASLINYLETSSSPASKGRTEKLAKRELGQPLERRRIAKILYPTQGLIVALDPDIPKERQKLFIEVQGALESSVLEIDGKKLSGTKDPINEGWTPVNGSHEVILKGTDGRVQDKVAFEVKGRLNES